MVDGHLSFAETAIDQFVLIIANRSRAMEKSLKMSYKMITSLFLRALKRFVARICMTKNIYSDNESNFVYAQKDLKSC